MKRIVAITLCFIVSLAVALPGTAFAASKTPSKPVITSATAVDNTVQITWKKTKNAKKYKVFVQTGTDGWKLWKTVKKTAKNKSKYSNKLKYKLKKSGKKYKVYTRVNPYKAVKTTRVRKYTYIGEYNTRYSFVIQAINGKKASRYSARKVVKTPDNKQDDQQENLPTTSITIDPIGAQGQADDGQYYVSEQVERITGTLSDSASVSKLSYAITARDSYVLSEGELTPAATWAIEPVILANGYNTLTVTARCKNGSSTSGAVFIYATIENNELDAQLANKDSDGDGLSDWFELNNSGTDPMNPEDGDGDQDGDGLTDREEQDFRSLSHVQDSDGDELDDYYEREAGTDPMNPDTDGDGVTDGKEWQFGTDPLSNDADRVVYAEETSSIDSDKEISVQVMGAASALQSLRVSPIPKASLISPTRIEGMLGQGISFSMDGSYDSAQVEIDLESEDYDESLSYGLYYVNEETAEFERVENQEIRYGRITAVLNHFSNYAVISDDEIVSAQKSLKVLFKPGSDAYWDVEDIDGDGFENSIDPTPYSADTFRTYEDYLRYFFPDTDAASMVVRVPTVGSSEVYNIFTGCGHSWIGYWHGTKTGSDEYSELAGFGSTESNAKAITTAKKGLQSWVKMWDEFRVLNTDGSVDFCRYEDNPGIKRETEGYMSLALPFAVAPDTYQKYYSFIDGYRELYNLYHNNCTTFMLRAFDSMGIESKVTNYIPGQTYADDDAFWSLMQNVNSAFVGFGDTVMSDAGSPGQAGYCIYRYYNYNYVLHNTGYVLKDGSKTGEDYGYSSQMSRELASFRSITDPDQINQETPDRPVTEATLDGHTYKLYDAGLTWRAAEAWCEDNGGHLVTITSQEEQDIVEQLLANGTRNSYWLGGLSTTTGDVLWVTNEEDVYKHWTSGQPDDYNGNENAMMVYRNVNPLDGNSGFGLWNDLLEDGTCNSEEFFGMINFGFIYESDE